MRYDVCEMFEQIYGIPYHSRIQRMFHLQLSSDENLRRISRLLIEKTRAEQTWHEPEELEAYLVFNMELLRRALGSSLSLVTAPDMLALCSLGNFHLARSTRMIPSSLSLFHVNQIWCIISIVLYASNFKLGIPFGGSFNLFDIYASLTTSWSARLRFVCLQLKEE